MPLAAMTRSYCAMISALMSTLLMSITACKQGTVTVAVPAKAGAIEGKTENSYAFIWRLFTEFTAPASKDSPSPLLFETWASDKDTFAQVSNSSGDGLSETWASDKDTFATAPHWPEAGEPMDLHSSVLGAVKRLDPVVETIDPNLALLAMLARPIHEDCKEPRGAAVGGFPTSGIPTPCI